MLLKALYGLSNRAKIKELLLNLPRWKTDGILSVDLAAGFVVCDPREGGGGGGLHVHTPRYVLLRAHSVRLHPTGHEEPIRTRSVLRYHRPQENGRQSYTEHTRDHGNRYPGQVFIAHLS